MDNLNSLLSEGENSKEILLDNELLKLLNGTPQQQKDMLAKRRFEPKKSGRNITASLLDHQPERLPSSAESKKISEIRCFYPSHMRSNQPEEP